MKFFLKSIGLFVLFIKKAWQRIVWSNIQKSMFFNCGKNVKIAYGCDFTYENISIGNNVYIGPYNFIITPIASVIIKDNVFFGPNVTISSGNHKIDELGKYMIEIEEKPSKEYEDVLIEEDVWIGANAILLKGVTIGKGSVIGAGAIVTKDVPPYTIQTGNSNVRTRDRFSKEAVELHESLLRDREYSYEKEN